VGSKHSLIFAVIALALCGAAFGDDLTGQASIIDGDTLEIHGTRIRLWGVDAPESSQLCRGEDSLQYRCGAKAANELDAFIAGRPVSCVPISLDQYGRTVATCSVGGVDLGEWLVRNGLALLSATKRLATLFDHLVGARNFPIVSQVEVRAICPLAAGPQPELMMRTVKVYKYKRPYDATKDDEVVSHRMGTASFIESVGGTIIDGTELEVDATQVDSEGKTKIGFNG
jgi:Staphylococcal nuclease homologue